MNNHRALSCPNHICFNLDSTPACSLGSVDQAQVHHYSTMHFSVSHYGNGVKGPMHCGWV